MSLIISFVSMFFLGMLTMEQHMKVKKEGREKEENKKAPKGTAIPKRSKYERNYINII